MELKFENLDKFIKEYYSHFLNINVNISYENNAINISYENINFGISIGDKFYVGSNLDSFFLKGLKDKTINLLAYLNKNVQIPISFKLRKKITSIREKSVFILGNDGDIGNISENNLNLLKKSECIYTNNKEGLIDLLSKLSIENKKIFLFSDVYNLDYNIITEITLFQYGDYFELDKEINLICSFLRKHFDRFFIQPFYSNFINKYSLSHTNYGSLLYLGVFDNKKYKTNSSIISNKINVFIGNTEKIISKFSTGSMLSLAGFSIEFKSFNILDKFIFDIKDNLNTNYLVEIIFEIHNGYYNLINYADKLDYDFLKNEINISNITVLIYYRLGESFVGYNRFNSKDNQKSFTFLSAPLSNISEFTNDSLKELGKSKYIYGESLEGLKNFLDNLKISSFDKELFYGDDIKKINEFSNSKIEIDSKVDLVKKAFPELIDLLNNSQKIYFLTDGGAPCILDPGDYIKKYINLYYEEYSVIGIKGPNVISTVLLGNTFKYKYIYWAPLNYTISPNVNFLKEINFFSENNFKDTLIIFYSFGKKIKDDFKILKKIFDKNIKIQIIGDIGTEREYNKIFDISNISTYEITYILENIDNTVYLLTF